MVIFHFAILFMIKQDYYQRFFPIKSNIFIFVGQIPINHQKKE